MGAFRTPVVTPTEGVAFNFDYPGRASSAASPEKLYFVLYNQSPFILSVGTQAKVEWCAAFTADVYELDVSPQLRVVLTPQSNIGNPAPIASAIYGTFYETKEELPLTVFPASLFGSTESILVDNPVTALSQNLSSGVIQALPANINLGAFQSYQAVFNFSNGAASTTNYATIQVKFFSDAALTTVLWSDTIEINPGNVRTFLNDRLHGPYMTLTPTFPGGTLGCILVLSNRVVDRLKLMEATDDDRILVTNELTTALNDGDTSEWHFAPVFHGPAYARFSGLGNGYFQFAFGTDAVIWQRSYNKRMGEEGLELLLPCRPLRWRVVMTDLDSPNTTSVYGFSLWARDN